MITYESTGTGVTATFRLGDAFAHPVVGATTTVPRVAAAPVAAAGFEPLFDVTDLGISTKVQDQPRGAPR